MEKWLDKNVGMFSNSVVPGWYKSWLGRMIKLKSNRVFNIKSVFLYACTF